MRLTVLLLVFPLIVANQTLPPNFLSNILHNSSLVSPQCYEEWQKFQQNLKSDLNSWGFQMVDSYSKIPKGLSTLKFNDLGDFDKCTSLENSQYCLGHVSFDKTSLIIQDHLNLVAPSWSFCPPKACNIDDVNLLGDAILKRLLDQSVSVTFSDLLCQTKEDVNPELSPAALSAITFLVFVFLIVLMSSWYDIYCTFYNSTLCPSVIRGFSVYSNSAQIFKFRKSNADHLPCLDGLKFISIMWVIVLHQFALTMSAPITNLDDLKNWSQKLSSMIFLSGDISVDTFFVIGGTLVSYGFFKARHKSIKFNLLHFYLHRYIRLTASFLFVVLFMATLAKYLGSGPNWPLFTLYFQESCEENWWSALLYVQNYATTKLCVGHTWYLDVDMQLYIISPIILFLLWKGKIFGLILLILGCLASVGASFYQIWWHRIPAIPFYIFNTRVRDYQIYYYLITHTRAAPWLIGVILGYYIFQIRQKQIHIKLNKYFVVLMWILCFGVLLTCVLGGHDLFINHQNDAFPNAFYAAFVRPVWAIGISWIIVACNINYSGPINWILSLPIFQIFNRFTYTIYLTHVLLLFGIIYSKKWPDYFNTFNNIYNFWGTLWISVGISILLVFMAECPILAIEKSVLEYLDKRKDRANCDAEKGVNNIAFENHL